MAGTNEELLPSERTERVVREYFEARDGWQVEKLDTGKERAADFRICRGGQCFLCEVKTVESVRANYPYRPIDYHREQRKKLRDEISAWQKENPDTPMVMPPERAEYIFGDEAAFERRVRTRKKYTQKWFNDFAEDLKDYLANSNVTSLPYHLRLDSDDLYAPSPQERIAFFKWLEDEIRNIDSGTPSWHWQVERLPYGAAFTYFARYPIHLPADGSEVRCEYSLAVEGPHNSGGLVVEIHCYGGLHLEAIERNIDKGVKQLHASASREPDQLIPQTIVLAFESGISADWDELYPHIVSLLKKHTSLSAIAVLGWTPDGIPPPEDGFLAWATFHTTTPRVPSFIVFHNRWLRDIKPLAVDAFTDDWSVQLSPLA